MKSLKNKTFAKVIGIISALAIIISALYVPMSFGASAAAIAVTEDETVTFGFETSEGSVDADDDGFSVHSGGGWGFGVRSDIVSGTTGIGFHYTNPVGWVTPGGYRLNNKDGLYYLITSSTYVVSFKLYVASAPYKTDSITRDATTSVSLGYGFTKRSGENYIGGMKKTVASVFSIDAVAQKEAGSAEFKLNSAAGTTVEKAGEKWFNLTYTFTTPESFDGMDNSLGFYANNYYGSSFIIDDVAVTKLSNSKGTVILVDEYYGTSEVLVGKIGDKATLPTLTGTVSEHEFLGWYKDENRTESADGITFAEANQVLYSKWKAPVTVTFVDTLNGGENFVSTGIAGEAITFPTDPTDTVNDPVAKWFKGWYTTAACTEKFADTVFGYSNLTVYSKWQGEIPDYTEDFESYTYDRGSFTFGTSLDKIDNPTTTETDKVIALDWDSTMTKDASNPLSYDAASRYNQARDRCFGFKNLNLIEGVTYTITFDYYVDTIADTQVATVLPLMASAGNIWEQGGTDYSSKQGANLEITSADKDGQWHTGKFIITAEYGKANTNTLYFTIGLAENTDTVIYINNVVFKAVQPYESTVTFKPNNGQSDIVTIGKVGDAISLPTVENGGLSFIGWYADAGLSTEFTATAFAKDPLVVYAKWSGEVIEFDKFSLGGDFSSTSYSISVDKTKGAGIEDNYALRWHFDGDKVIDSKGTQMYQKSGTIGHMTSVVQLKDNTTYEVTYYTKVHSANSDATLKFFITHGGNVYETSITTYAETERVISASDAGKGWVKKSVLFTTHFTENTFNAANVPDDMFFSFTVMKNAPETEIDVSIDRLIINEVNSSAIVFASNASAADGSYLIGNTGDDIVFPTLKNGEAEFLGWYTDSACENVFTGKTIPEGVTYLYARWSALPITFENYQYVSDSGLNWGVTMSLVNEKGVGVDGDDYLLNFTLVGDKQRGTNANGNPTYFRERITTTYDHIARLGTLYNNTAYKITYYYRSTADSNTDAQIHFATSDGNIWYEKMRKHYYNATQFVSADNKEWTKAETIIFTDFPNEGGNNLYIMFNGTNCTTTDTGRIVGVDIDNVTVERIEKPYVVYDGLNNSYNELVQGTANGSIPQPATLPTKFGYVFDAWYTDKECTNKFTQTTFNGAEAITVYAGYVRDTEVTFTFENWGIQNSFFEFGRGIEVVKGGPSYSGNYSIKIDRGATITANNNAGFCVIGDGTEKFKLDVTKKYVVTFKYYVETAGQNDAGIYFVGAANNNYYHHTQTLTSTYTINIMEEKGVWKTGALILDASKCDDTYDYLYIASSQGKDGMFYVDDITLTTLPDGHAGYVVDNSDCKDIPMYVTGALGTSFMSKLPKNPKKDNYLFMGYSYVDASGNTGDLTDEKAVFSEDTIRIVANFVRLVTVQDFDSGFISIVNAHADLSNMDFDYELYDSLAEGNSKDNVTSGRYSIHRKGLTQNFENAQLLTPDLTLSAGQRYTLTMKVKMGKYLQTDGAVKIASNRSPYYPWAVSGDYYAVVPVADLTDGEWHEVTYTFNSVEKYLTLQTPGYCEIFVDDVVLTRVDENTPLSSAPSYTEYVPALRDADGNLINQPAVTIDVKSIVDSSLGVEYVNILPYFIIGGAVIIVAAAAVIVLLVIKKRKKTV